MTDEDKKLPSVITESTLLILNHGMEKTEEKENDPKNYVIEIKSNGCKTDIGNLDKSGIFLRERTEIYAGEELTPQEYKKLIRKLDWLLIPILLLTATLGAVDKVSLSTAALYDIQKDLHLHGQQFSWVGSVLFFGSLAGILPMSWFMQRFRLGKVLAVCSFCWSALTLLQCVSKNFATMLVLRFLMGVVESCIVPGSTLMISRFYKKDQQCFRLSIVFVFALSVINGFLSWLIGNIPSSSPLPLWKYLYLLIGSISLMWSVFVLWYLPDTPMDFKRLTERERYFLVKSLALQSFTGMETNDWKWNQFKESACDVKTYLIFLFNVCINIPNGGLSTFSALIIKNLGFNSKQASLMSIPTGVVATLATLGFSYLIGKPSFSNKRCMLIICALIVPLIGSIINFALLYTGSTNVAPQLLGLYLLYFYFAPYVIFISLSQANTSGNTKKSFSYSLNYLGYCVGAIIGPQTFKQKQAPHYIGGFVAMLVAFCCCIVITIVYWLVCVVQNRGRTAGDDFGDTVTLTDVLDLSDKERSDFVYTT